VFFFASTDPDVGRIERGHGTPLQKEIAMVQRKISDLQSDHRIWLNEIDRWQFYLRSWFNEQQQLQDGFAKFKEQLDQYGRDLQAHADAIERHKNEILACERAMVEKPKGGDDAEPALAKAHAKSADHHKEQQALHEQLNRMHHTFLAQLGMLRHGSSRND